jgi:endonuclease/exonuclease/phosphatase family metal-dependent hydrolase
MKTIAIVPLLLALSAAVALAQPQLNPAENRPQVPWQEARQFIGEFAYVSGKVINVNTVGKITFINFDARQPRRFTGVVFNDKLTNFPRPPKEMYQGQIVRIGGVVSTFKDQPQIVVTEPSQIEVLDELPPKRLPPEAPRQEGTPGQLVVATYNMFNLFDDHDDPYRVDEETRIKPRAELDRLARSIQQLNADVIAVSEVENRDYLQRFVDVLLPNMGYEHVVLFEGNDLRGIDVGLISRVPIGPVKSHRHLTFDGPDGDRRRFGRDVLVATLEPPDAPPVDVWVVHLKSNAGGREAAEPFRLAEAREVRRLIDAELAHNAESRFIVTGDFNDTPESQTISTIVGADSGALWSVATDLPDPQLVTYNTKPYRSMIDFILCSPAMRRQYVPGSTRIPQGSIEATGSDHNPVAATFRLE